jgi:hypothetical protein
VLDDEPRWNADGKAIDEQEPGQIYSAAPYMHLRQTNNNTQQTQAFYQCPVYSTAAREGVLSTTGTSTNFVVALPLPPRSLWITGSREIRHCCLELRSKQLQFVMVVLFPRPYPSRFL